MEWTKRSTENLMRKRPVAMDAKMKHEGDFMVIMPFHWPRIHFLNRTAASLYMSIDGKNSVKDILELMLKTFPDVPEETLRVDLLNFMIHLLQRKVICLIS